MRSTEDMFPLPKSQELFHVAHFQTVILGNPKPESPQLHPAPEFLAVCLKEEITEFMLAQENGDLAGAADALVDLVYFALGGVHTMGLPWEEMFLAVHRANMKKHLGRTRRGHDQDAVKPEGWIDPKVTLQELLDAAQPR